MTNFYFILSLIAGTLYYVLYNYGFALEKQAIDEIDEVQKANFFSLLILLIRNMKWMAGLLLTMISIVFYFIALIWAPLIAIAPLTGIGLIFLILYAHGKAKERFSLAEILAIIGIVVSISVSSYISSLYLTKLNLDDWKAYINTYESYIFIVVILFIGVTMPIYSIIRNMHLSPITFGVFSGIASGLQTVVMKGLVLYLTATVSISSNILKIVLYIILFLLTALSSTGGLQMAFREGRISTTMSLYNGLMVIVPIMFGGIVLGEWKRLNIIHGLFLALAITIIITGIIVISIKHNHYKAASTSF